MVKSMKIYWKMIGNYYRPLEVIIADKNSNTNFVSKVSLLVIDADFACTPNFTDNVSILRKAVKITSTLQGFKLTLIKTATNTGKDVVRMCG